MLSWYHLQDDDNLAQMILFLTMIGNPYEKQVCGRVAVILWTESPAERD